jgi:hypothetical protein
MMRLFLIAAMLLLAGCTPEPKGDSYFPLQVGSRWTYDLTSDIDGAISHDTQVSSVPRTIDYASGDQVFVRRAEVEGGIGVEYWLRHDKVGISRIAQRTDVDEIAKLDPNARTVLKLPLTVGASWMVPTQTFVIGPKTDLGQRDIKMPKVLMTNVVEGMEEEVTVPAGTFKHCARVIGNGILPLYLDAVQGFKDIPIVNREWYCKGVGLVKVERVEQLSSTLFSGGMITMELTSYELP